MKVVGDMVYKPPPTNRLPTAFDREKVRNQVISLRQLHDDFRDPLAHERWRRVAHARDAQAIISQR